ncbi:MAG: hypothetical protein JRN54_06595 [Nitrososphaerota archaeon]|nr:hypothetical protein [Nitrososphaerota archaeon]
MTHIAQSIPTSSTSGVSRRIPIGIVSKYHPNPASGRIIKSSERPRKYDFTVNPCSRQLRKSKYFVAGARV